MKVLGRLSGRLFALGVRGTLLASRRSTLSGKSPWPRDSRARRRGRLSTIATAVIPTLVLGWGVRVTPSSPCVAEVVTLRALRVAGERHWNEYVLHTYLISSTVLLVDVQIYSVYETRTPPDITSYEYLSYELSTRTRSRNVVAPAASNGCADARGTRVHSSAVACLTK